MRFSSSLLPLVLAVVASAGNIIVVHANLRFPFNTLKQTPSGTHSSVRRDTSLPVHTLVARGDPNLSINYTGPGYVPKSYIIELNAQPGTSQATQQQATFVSQAKQLLNIQVRQSYNLLLNAVTINILDGGEWNANVLSTVDNVKSIQPFLDATSHSPMVHATGHKAVVLNRRKQASKSKPHKGASKSKPQKRAGPLKDHKPAAPVTDPNTGMGIKVGIIDTGIDYLHPAFGGCFGAGCKVAYGYDFVGDNYTGAAAGLPGSQPKPDADPLDTCNGHGTHVAGIIAASSDEVTGVAPAATLGAYRVFGCSGSVTMDVLVAAMERAAADNMDIINISIGTGKFFDTYWDAQAAQALVARGITVVASSGNDGTLNMGSINSPGIAPDVISVGSMPLGTFKAFYFILPSNGWKIRYLSSTFSAMPYGVVKSVKTEAKLAYACSPLKGNYTDKIILADRGNCTFETKAMNAQNAGALGVILPSVNGVLDQPSLAPGPTIPVFILEFGMYEKMIKYINSLKATGIKLQWQNGTMDMPDDTSTVFSAFSSIGPTTDLSNIKPDVTSYGESIFSTYPRALGSFAILSGTSMASPRVAGLAAAALQKLGSTVPAVERPAAVRRLVVQTSLHQAGEPYTFEDSCPVAFIGSGVARVINSTESNWGLSPTSIGYLGGAIGESNATRTFKITLTGNLPPGTVTFQYKLLFPVTDWSKRTRLQDFVFSLVDTGVLNPSTITITNPSTITNINTLRSETTTLTFTPADLSNFEADYWILSGVIIATHTNAATGVQTQRRIPFQTSTGDLGLTGPLDTTTPGYPRIDAVDATGAITTDDPSKRIVNTAGAYVATRFRLLSPSLWAFVTVEDTNGNTLGMANGISGGPLEVTKSDPNDDTWGAWTGLINPMPAFNQPQTTITAVPDGIYRLRAFAAHPFSKPADLNSSANYETWLSPSVTVTGVAAAFNASSTSATTQSGGQVTSVMSKFKQTGIDMALRASTMDAMRQYDM